MWYDLFIPISRKGGDDMPRVVKKTISLSPELALMAEEIAREEGKTT